MKDMGMYSKLNRRDFLKLAALLPLINIKWPGFEFSPNGYLGNKDLSSLHIF